MREEYPNCVIYTDNSRSSLQVLRSLRYSTHCEYYLRDRNNFLQQIEFPHFHDIVDLPYFYNNSGVRTFFIDCTNNNFLFGYKDEEILISEGISKKLQKVIDSDKVLFKNRVSRFLCNSQNEANGEFVFLIDFEGNCNPLAAFIETVKRKYYISSELLRVLGKFCDKVSNENLKNCIFSINIRKTLNDLKLSIHTSRYRESWEVFRALGINIPLIAIQNLLLRKVTTHLFVDPESLYLSEDKLFYNFSHKKFYFDLDETLICRGMPIHRIVDYLFSLKMRGKYLVLLTRHIFNIKNTLNSIGLNPSIFTEIIKVEKNQKKSDYIKINTDSVFIDNEFPERYDVWKNCGIDVLDLDQIDFIESDPSFYL